mmetsp:Transcript_56698/g.68220  ORF Transcript_56698/g.68220 Transcript_56698/m.68220 type:complete len:400 (-) Transcript_56698:82-1281(-)
MLYTRCKLDLRYFLISACFRVFSSSTITSSTHAAFALDDINRRNNQNEAPDANKKIPWTNMIDLPAQQQHMKQQEFKSSEQDDVNIINDENSLISDKGCTSENGKEDFVREDKFLHHHHLSFLDNTQDETRRRIEEMNATSNNSVCFAISTSEQKKGRGTSGRVWISSKGNSFLTVAIPMDSVPVPLTLLPLKVGSIIATQVKELLISCGASDAANNVSVKWPNDVLVDGGKIAGVLIESATDQTYQTWFMIGVGVNVAVAPAVDTAGENRGRRSTCVKDHCLKCNSGGDSFENNVDKDHSFGDGMEEATALANNIARDICSWIYYADELSEQGSNNKDANAKILLNEWREWVDWEKELVVRDSTDNEIIVPLGVEPDGQLRVRGQDGRERLLMVDYLL